MPLPRKCKYYIERTTVGILAQQNSFQWHGSSKEMLLLHKGPQYSITLTISQTQKVKVKFYPFNQSQIISAVRYSIFTTETGFI